MKISCVFWACDLGHMCAGGEPCMYVRASPMRAGRVGCVWAAGQVPTERPAGWPGCLSDRVSCVAGQLSALPKSTHLWTKQCRAWGPGNASPHPHTPTPPPRRPLTLCFWKWLQGRSARQCLACSRSTALRTAGAFEGLVASCEHQLCSSSIYAEFKWGFLIEVRCRKWVTLSLGSG